MAITLFVRGDQIGTYTGLSTSGNNNGLQVNLTGVQPLGTSSQWFRIEVRQVNAGQEAFQNGQMVDIYGPDDTLLFSSLNPQHDQFQGRASSSSHFIFTSQPVVLNLAGVAPDESGTLQFGPGNNPPRNENLSFDALETDPLCFVAGTRVATPAGATAIEALAPGDLVLTRDAGPQPVRWIGRRPVPGTGRFAPVCIRAGHFGAERDLYVSPQHRILVTDWRAELLFGETEVLVPAVALVDGRRVVRSPCARVDYVHLLFDTHQVVLAEGVASESFLPGAYVLSRDRDTAREIRALFPELASAGRHMRGVRALLSVREGLLLAG